MAAAGRVTIVLLPAAQADLTALQQRTGRGKTDLVNRAISLYEFVQAQAQAGRVLTVRDENAGTTQVVRFL